MSKRILALLCVMALSFSLFACGNNGKEVNTSESASKEESVGTVASEKESVPQELPKEPVELVYWYSNGVGEQEYTKEVEDKLNEILAATEGYEHITIRLHPCKDYATDVALAQVSGEQMDIISTANLAAETEIRNGAYIALDELLAANPEITAELPDWFMEMGKVDGSVYYVPNYQQCTNQSYLFTPKKYLDMSGYTFEQVSQILKSQDFDARAKFYEDYIVAVRKETGNNSLYLPARSIYELRSWIQNANYFVKVGSLSQFYWDEEKQEVAYSELNENIQKGYLKVADWYDKGFVFKDEITDKPFSGTTMFKDFGNIFSIMSLYGTEEMAGATKTATAEGEIVAIDFFDYFFLGHINAAGGTAISSSCEHPEDAAKVLALLFNSKYEEFYNTLCWGLEGIHYNKLSEGVIETLEFAGAQGNADTTYCFHKWRGGNTFNAWLNQSITQEQEDYILNEIHEGENTVVTPLVGFVVDTKPIENEISQMTVVVKEYQNTLLYGVKGKDAESYLNEYLDKLETAGLSKVLEELNRQVDEFLKNK